MKHIFEIIFKPEETTNNEVYKKQSFGKSLGYRDSMALLIIDLQRGFADPEVSNLSHHRAVSCSLVLSR